MKLRYTLPLLFSALLFSCNDSEILSVDANQQSNSQLANQLAFPADDGAIELTGSNSEKVETVLTAFSANIKNEIYSQYDYSKPSPSELAEIKAKADELVANCTTTKEKHDAIFNWIHDNVQYAENDYSIRNNAYDTFSKKKAVCQGYSELLNAMLYTQDIVNVIANGFMNTGNGTAGHAWNYTNIDGVWYLSDATNDIVVKLSDNDTRFDPTHLSCNLHEDNNFIYKFDRGHINIGVIKNASEQLVVPYSVNGYKITKFMPVIAYINTGETDSYGSPIFNSTTYDATTELYIGKNITDIGSLEHNDNVAIAEVFPNLKNIYVDPENTTLASHTGVLYSKIDGKNVIRVIAPKVEHIELLPMEIVDKECGLNFLEELQVLVLPWNAILLDAMSISYCPKLHEIQHTAGCWIEDCAVYSNGDESNNWQTVNLNETISFVEYIPTSVEDVKY